MKDFDSGSLLHRSDSDGELYLALLSSDRSSIDSAFTAISSSTWHRRLGHHGNSVFDFLVNIRFILCSNKQLPLCHACQIGKHCRMSFSSSLTKTSCLFELVLSDLWTSPVVSLSGFKYYVFVFG